MTGCSSTGSAGLSLKEKVGPIYVASRASIPERSAMWRQLRDDGWQITSSWIDEAGEGETADFSELWDRITKEIAAANKLVLYAGADDFPLKGAILEAGIALGMGKPVIVCLPGVTLEGRTKRPIGSWLAHRNVIRCDWLPDAMGYYNFERPRVPAQGSLESSQHIGWLKQYVEGMTSDNWQDMRLHARRQLDQLSKAVALPAQHMPEPISERDLAGLLANAVFAENLDEMPTQREEHSPSFCQDDMIDAAREIQQAGYVVTRSPALPSTDGSTPESSR